MYRYDESELPINADGLKIWLNDIWKQKENRLANFTSVSTFSSDSRVNNNNDKQPINNALYLALFFWTLVQVHNNCHIKVSSLIALFNNKFVLNNDLDYCYLFCRYIVTFPILVLVVLHCIFWIFVYQ